jgi:hypothetical protein
VKFGIFICFDIVFPSPSVELVKQVRLLLWSLLPVAWLPAAVNAGLTARLRCVCASCRMPASLRARVTLSNLVDRLNRVVSVGSSQGVKHFFYSVAQGLIGDKMLIQPWSAIHQVTNATQPP